MTRWAFIDEHGCVVSLGERPGGPVPDGAVAAPQGVPFEIVAKMKLGADGKWQERPVPPQPQETSDGAYWPDLPAGTVVEAADEGSGTLLSEEIVTGGSMAIQLPEDCQVLISVTPPSPWLPQVWRVVRGAGSDALRQREAESAREAARERLVREIARAEAGLVGRVSAGEMASWDRKEAAARAVIEGRGGASMLAVEAALTGETVQDLAARVIARAEAYATAAAAIAGLRRKTEADIAASDGSEAALYAVLERARARLAQLLVAALPSEGRK